MDAADMDDPELGDVSRILGTMDIAIADDVRLLEVDDSNAEIGTMDIAIADDVRLLENNIEHVTVDDISEVFTDVELCESKVHKVPSVVRHGDDLQAAEDVEMRKSQQLLIDLLEDIYSVIFVKDEEYDDTGSVTKCADINESMLNCTKSTINEYKKTMFNLINQERLPERMSLLPDFINAAWHLCLLIGGEFRMSAVMPCDIDYLKLARFRIRIRDDLYDLFAATLNNEVIRQMQSSQTPFCILNNVADYPEELELVESLYKQILAILKEEVCKVCGHA